MMRTLIAGIAAAVLLLTGLTAAPAVARYEPFGSTWAKDQRLKPRCDYYYYRYKVTVPSDNWGAEVFFVSPSGVAIVTDALLSNSDPDVGRSRVRLCRPSLTAGRYKIRMKVTYKVDYEKVDGFVRPSYFRLTRR